MSISARFHAGVAPALFRGPVCLLAAAALAPAWIRAQVVEINLTAAPGSAQVAPGVTVNGWLYNGSLPGPTLRITEGQTLRVRFQNNLPESTAIHWHGQPVLLGMDGVPDMPRPAVAAGQEFLYELGNLVPGTYWFHPHGHETQLDVGAAGFLIVDPANPANDPPFDVEQTIMLDDWTNPLGGGFTGHLLNGKSSAGQSPIVVQPGQRLRLRVVNAAATKNYVLALDGHSMTVTHADGHRVQPVVVQAIPIGIGERWDVIVDCNNPGMWSLAVAAIENRSATLVRGVLQYAGQTGAMPPATYVPANLASGSLLGYAQLASYFPVQAITATPNRSYVVSLGMGMGPSGMVHTINGETWPNVTPLLMSAGEQVQLSFVNNGMMMMPEYHPMHVHGHFLRLMGTAGGSANPPRKDTVLIRPTGQPGSSVQVQIAADNPGRWMLHCHNVDHMASGMMTLIDYTGDADADGLADRADQEPTIGLPVVAISDQATAFAPGATDAVRVQWTPARLFALFIGPVELNPPLVVPGLGTLVLDPSAASFYGPAVTSAQGLASLPYVIPNSPAIVGARIGMQGVGVAAPSNALVLSTFQAMTAR